MIKSRTVVFTDDTIELMANMLLSSRQYLLRFTGWNNYYDFRASKDDLKNLANTILSFIEEDIDKDNI